MEVFGSTNRINLNVANQETLFTILVYLDNMITNSKRIAENNFVAVPTKFYGFDWEDWRTDVIFKIKQSQSQKQVKELRDIETQLNELMSEDTKKTIQLQNLKELLGA